MKNTFRGFCCTSAIAVCLLSFTTLAHADIVQFGGAVNIAGDSDVSTNGDSIFAYSFGDNGTTDIINGVSFLGLNSPGNADVMVTNMGSNNGGAFANDTAGSAFSALSANYQDVLESGSFDGGSGLRTITLGNIVDGTNYEVQFWVNDARNRPDQTTIPRNLTIDGTGITLTYNAAGASTDAGTGQYVIGTFTGDASGVQTFSYTSNAPQLNAIQLRAIAVPEPSSLALLGLVGLASLVRRRR